VARPSSRVGRMRCRATGTLRGMIVARQGVTRGGNRTRLMNYSDRLPIEETHMASDGPFQKTAG
jgi:hypothetical protein